MEHVLVRARVAERHSIALVPNRWVYDGQVVVFVKVPLPLLQSTVHEAWVRHHASSMRTDLRYTPSDCFETFPFPGRVASLEAIGDRYHEHRRQIMLARQEGLTKTYNRFHDPDEAIADIQKLRQLHVEMDHAVAAAYGWTDLDLGYDFHQTKQGLRYTISEPARREVLTRLLKLNHERYTEEVRQGLHEKKNPKTVKNKAKKTSSASEPSLFGGEE
jgi:hypothetical protein